MANRSCVSCGVILQSISNKIKGYLNENNISTRVKSRAGYAHLVYCNTCTLSCYHPLSPLFNIPEPLYKDASLSTRIEQLSSKCKVLPTYISKIINNKAYESLSYVNKTIPLNEFKKELNEEIIQKRTNFYEGNMNQIIYQSLSNYYRYRLTVQEMSSFIDLDVSKLLTSREISLLNPVNIYNMNSYLSTNNIPIPTFEHLINQIIRPAVIVITIDITNIEATHIPSYIVNIRTLAPVIIAITKLDTLNQIINWEKLIKWLKNYLTELNYYSNSVFCIRSKIDKNYINGKAFSLLELINEFFSDYKRIYITGAVNSGKSSLTQRLISELNEYKNINPVNFDSSSSKYNKIRNSVPSNLAYILNKNSSDIKYNVKPIPSPIPYNTSRSVVHHISSSTRLIDTLGLFTITNKFAHLVNSYLNSKTFSLCKYLKILDFAFISFSSPHTITWYGSRESLSYIFNATNTLESSIPNKNQSGISKTLNILDSNFLKDKPLLQNYDSFKENGDLVSDYLKPEKSLYNSYETKSVKEIELHLRNLDNEINYLESNNIIRKDIENPETNKILSLELNDIDLTEITVIKLPERSYYLDLVLPSIGWITLIPGPSLTIKINHLASVIPIIRKSLLFSV